MSSPSVDMMWQQIRRLKQRVCELEEEVERLNSQEDLLADVWIDWDETPVQDSDGELILHGQTS